MNARVVGWCPGRGEGEGGVERDGRQLGPGLRGGPALALPPADACTALPPTHC
jgi:hypothetical protein